MTLSDVGEGVVKYSEKCSDVICGWSLGDLRELLKIDGCNLGLPQESVILRLTGLHYRENVGMIEI